MLVTWKVRPRPRRQRSGGRQPADLLAPHVDLSGVVGEIAGDQVEERGLPGAVRADDRAQIAGGHGEVHAVDGLDAAEVLLEADRAER